MRPRGWATQEGGLMTGLEFMARLAALIGPPRYPLLRYAGVLGPRSAWRKDIVPKPRERRPACDDARDEWSDTVKPRVEPKKSGASLQRPDRRWTRPAPRVRPTTVRPRSYSRGSRSPRPNAADQVVLSYSSGTTQGRRVSKAQREAYIVKRGQYLGMPISLTALTNPPPEVGGVESEPLKAAWVGSRSRAALRAT